VSNRRYALGRVNRIPKVVFTFLYWFADRNTNSSPKTTISGPQPSLNLYSTFSCPPSRCEVGQDAISEALENVALMRGYRLIADRLVLRPNEFASAIVPELRCQCS
jgi:hypothetical protein